MIECAAERRFQGFGRALALVAAGLLVYGVAFPPEAGWRRELGQFGPAVALVLAAALMLWEERLTIDFTVGKLRYRRGIRPFSRVIVLPLTDVDRITHQFCTFNNLYGEAGRHEVSTLYGPGLRCSIVGPWPVQSDDPSEAVLASRLGKSLERLPPKAGTAARRRFFERGTQYVAWASMAAIAGVMLIPVLTGRRPARAQNRFNRFPPLALSQAQGGYQAGVSYYQRGEYKSAEREFEAVLKTVPNNAEAYNMLAYACAEQGKLDDALRWSKQALSLSPRAGHIMDTVAEMYQRKADFRAALSWYQEALRYSESQYSAETNCKFGMTLLELGRRPEAERYLKSAAILPPQRWNRRARQILEDLESGRKPDLSLAESGG